VTTSARSADAVRRMLEARSIAVVGASGDPSKIGYLPVDYLVKFGYGGTIYPVNPRLVEVRGHTAYPSLAALPEVPDVVAVMVGAARVPAVLEEAGRLGVPGVVVITAGFAEVDQEGAALQGQLVEIADSHGMWMIGPNSVGIIHSPSKMALTFTAALRQGPLAPSGRIGIVSQSGAFGTVLYGVARHAGLRIHSYISAGNEAQLGVPEFIAAMVEHPDIQTIGGYVEGIRDGRAFLDVALAARQAGKPIVLVKVGASAAGATAAASHTGALTGSDRAYDAAFDRVGVARAADEQHMLDLLQAFDVLDTLPKGNRLAIASMSGGAGVQLCDSAEAHGLQVLPFGDDVIRRLSEVLPSFAAVANPVDFTGQFVTNPTGLRTVMRELAAADTADAVVLFAGLGWSAGGGWVDPVIEATGSGSPIFVVSPLATEDQRNRLTSAGVPIYETLRQATQVIKSLVAWRSWQPPEEAPPMPGFALPGGTVTEVAAKAVLAEIGIRIPRGLVARSPEDAAAAAASIGGPVVMKVQAEGLDHKSEAGGVRVGVAAADVAATYSEIVSAVDAFAPAAPIRGVLVEEMISGGVEAVVGTTWQPPFGHVVMVGLGGVTVELLGDVAFALAPVGPAEARSMIESLRAYAMLDGYRGLPRLDVDALAEAVSLVSRLAAGSGPNLSELDVNPIRVLPVGCGVAALDALMVTSG
jgi:acyl-CoA synthetase (NDP forming)